jgi:hypothetical protein
MRKLATGEPCAGDPHARFGGRGGGAFPTPIVEVGGRAELGHECVREDALSARCKSVSGLVVAR